MVTAAFVVAFAMALAMNAVAAFVQGTVVAVVLGAGEVAAVRGFLSLLGGFLMVEVRLVAGGLALVQLAVGFAPVDALLLPVIAAVNLINARVTWDVGRLNAAGRRLGNSGSARIRCCLCVCC